MSPGSKKMRWTPSMVDTLLDHLESHKGELGLYYTNRKAAYESAIHMLSESHPSVKFSSKHIKSKLSDLCRNLKDPTRGLKGSQDRLFRGGRHALRPQYTTKLLQEKQKFWDHLSQACPDAGKAGSTGSVEVQVPAFRPSLPEPPNSMLIHAEGSRPDVEGIFEPRTSARDIESLLNAGANDSNLSGNDRMARDDGSERVGLEDDESAVTPETNQYRSADSLVLKHGSGSSLFTPAQRPYLSALESSFVADPRIYGVGWKEMKALKDELHERIISNVKTVIEWRNRGHDGPFFNQKAVPLANFFLGMEDTPFSELCDQIFDARSPRQLRDRAAISPLPLDHFLGACLSAAVYKWVFQRTPRSLPSLALPPEDKTCVAHRLITKMRIDCPRLFDQYLLEVRSAIVRQDTDYGEHGRFTAVSFIAAMQNFLAMNRGNPTEFDELSWLNDLSDTFALSMRIKALMNLAGNLQVLWPTVGDRFEPQQMDAANSASIGSCPRIKAILFPGLAQMPHDDPTKGIPPQNYLWRPIVFLSTT